MKYIAKQAERLDTIVFDHYQDLQYLPLVLEKNPKYLNTIELRAGDEIFLPKIKTTKTPTIKDEKSLF